MKLASLKRLRVVASLIFFVLTSLLFLDFYEVLPPAFYDYVLFLQFVPSIMKFLTNPEIIASGFLFVFVLTILFGRIYCSSICPIGFLQDVFSHLKWKISKKKLRPFSYKKPLLYIWLPILALTVISFLAGSMSFINLLDPYSNFGRIMNNLALGPLILANNLISGGLHEMDIFGLHQVDTKLLNFGILAFPIVFLLTILFLSFWRGRLYCNTICPVGALLGMFSRFSLFRIKMNTESCTACGLCEKACKAECIDQANHKIDFDRCVGCFNCFDACKQNGFEYEFAFGRKSASVNTDSGRRNAMKTGIASLAGLTACTLKSKKDNAQSSNAVSPPGSHSITHFTSRCTACHLCVSACPTQVIQPSLLEYGVGGILQVKMDFRSGFCNYDCTVCGEICPSGAILALDREQKHKTQIGRVMLLENICVVFAEGTDCGACAEHCPTKAVHMIPYGELMAPEIDPDICVGCGACEYACPTIPDRAIFVATNLVHEEAQKPEIEELDYEEEEDFPF